MTGGFLQPVHSILSNVTKALSRLCGLFGGGGETSSPTILHFVATTLQTWGFGEFNIPKGGHLGHCIALADHYDEHAQDLFKFVNTTGSELKMQCIPTSCSSVCERPSSSFQSKARSLKHEWYLVCCCASVGRQDLHTLPERHRRGTAG